MSDTPATKKGSGVYRISFSLDVEAYPQLAYIMDLKGHGRRPQEFLRLALLGAAYDEAAKRLMAPDAHMAGSLPVMWSPTVGAAAPVPVAPQSAAVTPAPAPSQVAQEQVTTPAPAPQPHTPAPQQPAPVQNQEPTAPTQPNPPTHSGGAPSTTAVAPAEPEASSNQSGEQPRGDIGFLA